MENQPLENRYLATEQMLAEYFARLRPAFSKVMYGCCLAALSLLLIAQLFLQIWLYDLSPLVLTLFGLALLGLGFTGLPLLEAKHALMQRKTIHGGESIETVTVFGDTIVLSEGTHRSEYHYEQIKKVVCLKHSYALMLDRRIGILVSPEGFQNGTAEDLLNLLRERIPGIIIK